MKKIKYFICVIFSILALSITVSAKNKCVPKVYIFGVAASFNDSIVYLTDIQELDSAWITDKSKFLLNRNDYSYQLKNYFEMKNIPHRTCVISYALKRKEADKKYQKIKNRYVKNRNINIKYVSSEDFRFTSIKPE